MVGGVKRNTSNSTFQHSLLSYTLIVFSLLISQFFGGNQQAMSVFQHELRVSQFRQSSHSHSSWAPGMAFKLVHTKVIPSVTTITGNPVVVHMKVVACSVGSMQVFYHRFRFTPLYHTYIISNLNTGNINAEFSCTRTVLSSLGVALSLLTGNQSLPL